MDLLKQAIEQAKKRKLCSALSSGSGGSGGTNGEKKFKTRREIQQEKANQTSSLSTSTSTSTSLPSSSSSIQSPSAPNTLSTSSLTSPTVPSSTEHVEQVEQIDVFEVKKKLRQYNEPILLFGESAIQQLQRLKLYELNVHEKTSGTSGRGNVFQTIMQQDVESELKAAMSAEMEQARAEQVEQEQTQEQLLNDRELKKKQQVEKKAAALNTKQLRREDFQTAEEYVMWFFKLMLSEWESDLDARTTDVKMSVKGRHDSATQKSTRQFLKPFFKLLKTHSCDADILKHATNIVTACLNRDYKLAEECYLTMAIGNAPWPMGVTMVGIHERSGREKIFDKNVAHVLNDETTRKYIQSIKRLVTYSEEKYPPAIANH